MATPKLIFEQGEDDGVCYLKYGDVKIGTSNIVSSEDKRKITPIMLNQIKACLDGTGNDINKIWFSGYECDCFIEIKDDKFKIVMAACNTVIWRMSVTVSYRENRLEINKYLQYLYRRHSIISPPSLWRGYGLMSV